MNQEKVDVIDLLIASLKEHEKILDQIEEKFEKIVERFENEHKTD